MMRGKSALWEGHKDTCTEQGRAELEDILSSPFQVTSLAQALAQERTDATSCFSESPECQCRQRGLGRGCLFVALSSFCLHLCLTFYSLLV